MKILQLILITTLVLPSISVAEIWAYQIKGKEVSECRKRPESTIDEVWARLEQATGLDFDISRDSMLIPGYILQNSERRLEYIFYPSKISCEFEREAVAASIMGDRAKMQQIKESLTKEKQITAMSPADIPASQKQHWINFFAGCSNRVLKENAPLKGSLQKLVDNCDCTARKFLNIKDNKNLRRYELEEKLTEFAAACQIAVR